MSSLPVIALVGRPNTGKSTLFNRLTRSQRAVVDSMPGVTRDRNISDAEHRGRRYLLVDTGGFEEHEEDDLARAVRAQSLLAADEADAIVVVVDGRAGLNALDRALFEQVRRFKKPVFVAVNKIDTAGQQDLVAEFYALGCEDLHPISAEHGLDVGPLMDAVLRSIEAGDVTEGAPAGERGSRRAQRRAARAGDRESATGTVPADEEAEMPVAGPTAVAVIGRPNVGKSSLLNRLVGYERAIVSHTPGTTRDPLDTPVSHGGKEYVLVDTAGIRRRPRVQEYVEKASVVRALRALERAEIALLVVDGEEGMTEQDARVSSYAWERGRALALLVNKWDAVPREKRDPEKFSQRVDQRYPSFTMVPRLFISAKTGEGVGKIWKLIDHLAAAHRLQMQTARLNEVIERAERQQAPPMVRGKRPRLFYATQTAISPPTVTIFTSAPTAIHASYERYLTNQIRAAFPLEGTPLRLRFRSRRKEAGGSGDKRAVPTASKVARRKKTRSTRR